MGATPGEYVFGAAGCVGLAHDHSFHRFTAMGVMRRDDAGFLDGGMAVEYRFHLRRPG